MGFREELCARGWRLALAESCTGGLCGARLTATSGASAWFAGAVVAYDNRLKISLLGVDEALLVKHGAVSAEVGEAMAAGVCRLTGCELGLALTGVAGPGGGSAEKPVGLVYVALASPGSVVSRRLFFEGDREAIRAQAVSGALALLEQHEFSS